MHFLLVVLKRNDKLLKKVLITKKESADPLHYSHIFTSLGGISQLIKARMFCCMCLFRLQHVISIFSHCYMTLAALSLKALQECSTADFQCTTATSNFQIRDHSKLQLKISQNVFSERNPEVWLMFNHLPKVHFVVSLKCGSHDMCVMTN